MMTVTTANTPAKLERIVYCHSKCVQATVKTRREIGHPRCTGDLRVQKWRSNIPEVIPQLGVSMLKEVKEELANAGRADEFVGSKVVRQLLVWRFIG